MLTVLFLGDIVGQPGRAAVIARLPELKTKYALDFVIVNGENAAGGRGITGKITIDLLRGRRVSNHNRRPYLGPERDPFVHRHRTAFAASGKLS